MKKPSLALKADEQAETQRYDKLLKKNDVHVHYPVSSDAPSSVFGPGGPSISAKLWNRWSMRGRALCNLSRSLRTLHDILSDIDEGRGTAGALVGGALYIFTSSYSPCCHFH